MARILPRKETQKRLGISHTKLYELVNDGLLPRPVKLVPGGRAGGWLESEIDAFIEKRAAARNLTPAE